MDLKDEIRGFIQSDLLAGQGAAVNDNDSLIESGVIDSLGIQKLLDFLERKFSVKLGDEEIVPENFETVASIAALIRAKVRG
jgi:acyl carrier protein